VVTPDGSRFMLDSRSTTALSAQARALLAQKLAGGVSHAAQALGSSLMPAMGSLVPPPPPPPPPAGAAAAASPCVLLRNVFDSAVENAGADASWDASLAREIEAEAAAVGQCRVLHCAVQRDSPTGDVFILMSELAGTSAVVAAFHGRSFAGRTLAAEEFPLETYVALFPAVAAALVSPDGGAGGGGGGGGAAAEEGGR